jgi:hypothetical protein
MAKTWKEEDLSELGIMTKILRKQKQKQFDGYSTWLANT